MTQEYNVEIGAIPSSVEDFVALRDEVAKSPEGGAAMMVVALLAYTHDEALGRACLTVAVDRKRLQEGAQGYQGWQLRRRDLQMIDLQLAGREYMPRSYVQGAAPENGYALPDPPHTLRFVPDPRGGDRDSGIAKVFVISSGADSPRPVTLHQNQRGIWKAYEWSSLLSGVRAPREAPPEDL
jgi:hypothetical protein